MVQGLSYLMTLRNTCFADISGSHLGGQQAVGSGAGGSLEEMLSILPAHGAKGMLVLCEIRDNDRAGWLPHTHTDSVTWGQCGADRLGRGSPTF